MRLERVHLLGEFQWVCPVVISFTESDIASPYQGKDEFLGDADSLGILVLFLEYWFYDVGVPGLVFPDNPVCPIG